MSAGQSMDMMKILAPLVMGSLGKAKKEGWLDASAIAWLVTGASKNSSMLTMFLDKNGDGDVKDDLLKMGMNYLKGKFFK
jgi:hypothetical protein